jgi:hypothetical protein
MPMRDRSSPGHDLCHGLGRHQGDGAAVVEDVLHLAGTQMGVDRRVEQPDRCAAQATSR